MSSWIGITIISYLAIVSLNYLVFRFRLKLKAIGHKEFHSRCNDIWVPMFNVCLLFFHLFEITVFYAEKVNVKRKMHLFREKLYSVSSDGETVKDANESKSKKE